MANGKMTLRNDQDVIPRIPRYKPAARDIPCSISRSLRFTARQVPNAPVVLCLLPGSQYPRARHVASLAGSHLGRVAITGLGA